MPVPKVEKPQNLSEREFVKLLNDLASRDCDIETLDLSGLKINDKPIEDNHIEMLAKSLKKNNSINSINFQNIKFTKKGLEAIANFFADNITVSNVQFDEIEVGFEYPEELRNHDNKSIENKRKAIDTIRNDINFLENPEVIRAFNEPAAVMTEFMELERDKLHKDIGISFKNFRTIINEAADKYEGVVRENGARDFKKLMESKEFQDFLEKNPNCKKENVLFKNTDEMLKYLKIMVKREPTDDPRNMVFFKILEMMVTKEDEENNLISQIMTLREDIKRYHRLESQINKNQNLSANDLENYIFELINRKTLWLQNHKPPSPPVKDDLNKLSEEELEKFVREQKDYKQKIVEYNQQKMELNKLMGMHSALSKKSDSSAKDDLNSRKEKLEVEIKAINEKPQQYHQKDIKPILYNIRRKIAGNKIAKAKAAASKAKAAAEGRYEMLHLNRALPPRVEPHVETPVEPKPEPGVSPRKTL